MLARDLHRGTVTANGSRSATLMRSATISGASMSSRDQYRELVAADAGERVTFSDAPLQSLAHRAKQLVASCVPEPIVDFLEIVDIDVDQHEFAVPHRILEPLREQHPVGQSGQWVVVHLMGESALHLIQLQGQPPLRANRDHLPDRDEEDHRQCRGDQDRVHCCPSDQYVEGEQHRDAEEPAVGQDQLRPVHSVFVATGYPPLRVFEHGERQHQRSEHESDTAPEVTTFDTHASEISDHPVGRGDDHDAPRQQEVVRTVRAIPPVHHGHEYPSHHDNQLDQRIRNEDGVLSDRGNTRLDMSPNPAMYTRIENATAATIHRGSC